MENLKKWTLYAYEKFSKLIMKMPYEKQEEIKKQYENYIKLWEEPSDEEVIEKPSEENIQLKLEMPLKEGLLRINLGVPFLFVVNKTDIVNSSSDKKRFEEDSEFIFKHIRKFAISCKINIVLI